VCVALGGSASIGFGHWDFSLPMAETQSAPVDQPIADDLISFLKAIPDGRYRRGVRYQPRLELTAVDIASLKRLYVLIRSTAQGRIGLFVSVTGYA
jgi:hypothetical protein